MQSVAMEIMKDLEEELMLAMELHREEPVELAKETVEEVLEEMQ